MWMLCLLTIVSAAGQNAPAAPRGVVVIYADDIGYGDLSCYGAKAVSTPACDRLAREGLRLTAGYSCAATCTPSRYGLMTGEYAFRKKGTGILPGDAALIIEPGRPTLPSLLKAAGYTTGVVGKWHLGLGTAGTPIDWNKPIAPGPREIGFDSAFIMPATGDRVPCVYVENGLVRGLDPADPISISYQKPFPGLPTGQSDRANLRMDWSHGHNMAVVGGIGRIGYMKGGAKALWDDETMADTFAAKAVEFIEKSRDKPFFLFLATHDIHVPRVPNPRFVGKTTMGPRGDCIAEFDDTVGKVLATLDRLGLARDTLVLLTSDNGPVLDDGYKDQSVEKIGAHKPAGPWRGGKSSMFEGGTRVPLIVRWPAGVAAGKTSDAVFSQIDMLASLSAICKTSRPAGAGPDSVDHSAALIGDDKIGRSILVQQAGGLAIRKGVWKYLEPRPGPAVATSTNTETGNHPKGQLFNLKEDPGELDNRIGRNPDEARQLAKLLETIQADKR